MSITFYRYLPDKGKYWLDLYVLYYYGDSQEHLSRFTAHSSHGDGAYHILYLNRPAVELGLQCCQQLLMHMHNG